MFITLQSAWLPIISQNMKCFSPSSFRHLLLLLPRKLFSLIFTWLALFHSFHLSPNITSLERLEALMYLKEYSFPFLVCFIILLVYFIDFVVSHKHVFLQLLSLNLWPFSNKIITHIVKDVPQLSPKPEMVLGTQQALTTFNKIYSNSIWFFG